MAAAPEFRAGRGYGELAALVGGVTVKTGSEAAAPRFLLLENSKKSAIGDALLAVFRNLLERVRPGALPAALRPRQRDGRIVAPVRCPWFRQVRPTHLAVRNTRPICA